VDFVRFVEALPHFRMFMNVALKRLDLCAQLRCQTILEKITLSHFDGNANRGTAFQVGHDGMLHSSG
jgi:hypothetical protein